MSATTRVGLRPRQGSYSVYVHFPWCLKRCAYCDFATSVSAVIPRARYCAAILAELELRTRDLLPAPIGTVFFGGGTPSLWGAGHVSQVLHWLDNWAGLAADAELTLEANPGALESTPLLDYTAAGINRVSIGVQALHDQRLTALGRLHDAAAARRTLAELADLLAGGKLRSASADLIFGSPGQTMAHLHDDVQGVMAYGLPHLSAYALTVEEGTPLHTRVARGLQAPPDEDLQADMLAVLPQWLSPHGLQRYEVSNFAKPGHHSRHNLTYWQGGHWLAVGVGAHGNLPGALGDQRYGNHRGHDAWFADVEAGRLPEALREVIDAPTLVLERVMMSLRLTSGIDLSQLARDAGDERAQALRHKAQLLAATSPIAVRDDHIRADPAAFGQLDALIRALT